MHVCSHSPCEQPQPASDRRARGGMCHMGACPACSCPPHFAICHEWRRLLASSVPIQTSLCFCTALYLCNYLFKVGPLLSKLLKGKEGSIFFTAVFSRHQAAPGRQFMFRVKEFYSFTHQLLIIYVLASTPLPWSFLLHSVSAPFPLLGLCCCFFFNYFLFKLSFTCNVFAILVL